MDLCEDHVSVLFYYYHNGEPDLEKLGRMDAKIREQIQVRLHGNGTGNPVKG